MQEKGFLWYLIVYVVCLIATISVFYLSAVILASVSPIDLLGTGIVSILSPIAVFILGSWSAATFMSKKSSWKSAEAHILALKIILACGLMLFAILAAWAVFIANLSFQYFPYLNFFVLITFAYLPLFYFLYRAGK